mgnify:CR=1 FL=1
MGAENLRHRRTFGLVIGRSSRAMSVDIANILRIQAGIAQRAAQLVEAEAEAEEHGPGWLALLIVGLIVAWRGHHTEHLSFLLMWLIGGLALYYIAVIDRGAFNVRYSSFITPALYALLGIALAGLGRIWRPLTAVGLLVMLAGPGRLLRGLRWIAFALPMSPMGRRLLPMLVRRVTAWLNPSRPR